MEGVEGIADADFTVNIVWRGPAPFIRCRRGFGCWATLSGNQTLYHTTVQGAGHSQNTVHMGHDAEAP